MAAGGRKRVRVRAREVVVVRCQVKGCEADIRELNGYHRRHRVCLRCANASSVVIDREVKRYCQQCGKFHVLPDFDEGKRSCRRKLERHNKRRRRRPTGVVSVAEEKGSQVDPSEEAINYGEQKEGNEYACETAPSSKVNDGGILLESDGHDSPICSLPSSQNIQSNNIFSFTDLGETRIDVEKDNSKTALSSTICDNRSAYSSLLDGSSLMNIKMEVKATRIHYVHPTYFEAGKPIEFVAFGSNLNQPKFRFLVSFAGKYMIYDSCAISYGKITSDGNEENSCHDFNHEMVRIRISRTDSDIFGPAFVEVENESGISDFIPIRIGNKHICTELERMQVALSGSFMDSLASQIAISNANPSLCELLVAKQTALSELLVDVAWLLKKPCIDESRAIFNSINLQRLTCLLNISIQNELVNILEVILKYLDVMNGTAGIQDSNYIMPDADSKLLQGYVDRAKEILNERDLHDVRSELDLGSLKQGDVKPQSYVIRAKNQAVTYSILSIKDLLEKKIQKVGKYLSNKDWSKVQLFKL